MSVSVLKCIRSETKRFHTFESNRLTVIRAGSSTDQWRHVPGKENPADDASKGLKLDAMLKNNRWLEGPDFLWKEDKFWPAIFEVPLLKDGDPEVRKEATIYTVTLDVKPLDVWIKRHSSWWKLKRAIAWMLRLKELLRNKAHSRGKKAITSDGRVEVNPKRKEEIVTVRGLTVDEVRKAEEEIIRHVQQDAFPDVMQILEERELDSTRRSIKGSLKKAGTSIHKLDPMLKKGVLVVGGRLSNAPVDEERKHPMILPYKHHVTNLVIEQHHTDLGHMGQESVCVVPAGTLLGGERQVSGAKGYQEVHGLSEAKGPPWRTVHGGFASGPSHSPQATFHLRWNRLLWSAGSKARTKSRETLWLSFYVPDHASRAY